MSAYEYRESGQGFDDLFDQGGILGFRPGSKSMRMIESNNSDYESNDDKENIILGVGSTHAFIGSKTKLTVLGYTVPYIVIPNLESWRSRR